MKPLYKYFVDKKGNIGGEYDTFYISSNNLKVWFEPTKMASLKLCQDTHCTTMTDVLDM